MRLREIVAPPSPSPGCIPTAAGATGPASRLPEPVVVPPRTPEEVDPGVADGMTAKPKQP